MMKRGWDPVAEARQRIENLSVEQVEQELSGREAVLVDLREEHERQQEGAIPGAIHVPSGELRFAVDPASPLHRPELAEDARLILHCAVGGRSAMAADALRQRGYRRVAHLDGGFKAWRDAGRPVAAPGPPPP